MTFIEVKGAAEEPAFVKAEAIDAVEFYEPRGNLRVYTRSGRTYYAEEKPEEFLARVEKTLYPLRAAILSAEQGAAEAKRNVNELLLVDEEDERG